MKYFDELTLDDKERAIAKILQPQRLRFNCLLRAYVVPIIMDEPEAGCEVVPAQPASVIKFYYEENELKCDVVFDLEPNVISKGHLVDMIAECKEERKNENASLVGGTKDQVVKFLTGNKNFMFDNKCNTYPV